jgi:hypothetical protein
MKLVKVLKQKGFVTMTDVLLSVAVGAVVSLGLLKFQAMAAQWASYAQSAQNVQQIGAAADQYVARRFLSFVNLDNAAGGSSDPGPRVCNAATSTCYFTTATLVNEGYLPQGFKIDPRSGGYVGFVSVVANNPNAVLKGYLISQNQYGLSPILTTGIPQNTASNQNNMLAVIQNAGVDAGYTTLNGGNVIGNSIWGWNLDLPIDTTQITGPFNNHIIYRIGFGSTNFSTTQASYMQLNGSTPMQAALNLGGNSIYGASTMHANSLTTAGVQATTSLNVNEEEDGTVYNGNSLNDGSGPMPNRLGISGLLQIGNTPIAGSNASQLSSISSPGPVSITSSNGTGTGNATIDAGQVNLATINVENATLQEGSGYSSRTYGVNANQITNYANTAINNPSNISLQASSVQAGSMTSTLQDDSTAMTTIANYQGDGTTQLRNVTADQIYALQSSSGNSINATSYGGNTTGVVQFASESCVNAGSDTKCGSNINASTGYATLAGGVSITNVQVPYTTCSGTNGLNPLGTTAVSSTNSAQLLSCTDIGSGNYWVPIAKGARTYTYIGTSSVSCPTDMTYVTGGASCSGGQLSSAGTVSGNTYSGATCSAGPAANIVIICRY